MRSHLLIIVLVFVIVVGSNGGIIEVKRKDGLIALGAHLFLSHQRSWDGWCGDAVSFCCC